jgi:hypothetical protein
MAAAEEPIVNTPFPDSWLPIHHHAVLGDAAALESDLASNPALPRLVNVPTQGGGFTPLALAAEKGHVDAMAWLLAHGADPCAANDDGLAPLALAARAGQVGALQLLLASSTPEPLLAQADRWGRVPLLVAAAHGQAPAFACLLDALLARAPQTQQGKEAVLEGLYATGEGGSGTTTTTLLVHACRLGHAPIVRVLLTRGADPFHGIPLEAAKASGSAPCEALLKEWERIYELAKARAVDDASQAAAAMAALTVAASDASDGNAAASPSVAVTVAGQARVGAVAAEAVKSMADDTFAALVEMLGARTTGEAVEEMMGVEEEEGEGGDLEATEQEGEGRWDW